MSAFGGLPLSSKNITFDAVAASSNKCLEGVPGVGFILMKNQVIENAKGNCHSLSLDLYDQWTAMEKNKQWRFTPPTHVLAAFNQAIAEHEKEGGVAGRHERYKNNCKIICDGMKEIGFEQLLPNELQAPIIITFKQPNDPNFNFQQFYNGVFLCCIFESWQKQPIPKSRECAVRLPKLRLHTTHPPDFWCDKSC